MWKQLWEWQVDGEVVRVGLNLLTGRRTVAIAGDLVFDKISLALRSKIPLRLSSGRSATVTVSTRWNLTPRCVLDVEGRPVEPDTVPTPTKLQRTLAWATVLLFAAGATLILGPWMVGGPELPPPRWTIEDLGPMPDQGDNAWSLIGTAGVPDWDRWLLDDVGRIPAADLQVATEKLAHPDVVALLAQVPDVIERPELVVPEHEAIPGAARLQDWRYWLALSLSTKLEHEPEQVAYTLSRTLPTWIRCANTARSCMVFFSCAKQAERDLVLMKQTLEYLPRGDESEGRALLRTALAETPAPSRENAIRARYLESYGVLESLVADRDVLVDKRATLESFHRLMSPGSIEAFCQHPPKTDLLQALYVYNALGEMMAESAAYISCACRDRSSKVAKSVAEARRDLIARLD